MNLWVVVFIFFISIALFICSFIALYKNFSTEIYTDNDLHYIMIFDNRTNTVEILTSVAEAFLNNNYPSKFIIVDGGMSRGQKELCLKYSERYDFIIYCIPSELNEVIFTLKKENSVVF